METTIGDNNPLERKVGTFFIVFISYMRMACRFVFVFTYLVMIAILVGIVCLVFLFLNEDILQEKSQTMWAASVSLPNNETPVDCVFLWENLTSYNQNKQVLDNYNNVDDRMLRFALRSVEINAPWVRNIYLVTNGQVPEWWNYDNPRAKIINHFDIFISERVITNAGNVTPEGVLPTFNKNAIETKIRHIPGLAPFFVYLDNGALIGNPITVDYFIDEKRNRLKLQHGDFIAPRRLSSKFSLWHSIVSFSNNLLNNFLWNENIHRHYYASNGCHFFSKKVLDHIGNIWSHEITRSTQNVVGNEYDLDIPFLHMNLAYEEGLATLEKDSNYLRIGHLSSIRGGETGRVFNSDAKCLLLQNDLDEKQLGNTMEVVVEELCKRYPYVSEFENSNKHNPCDD